MRRQNVFAQSRRVSSLFAAALATTPASSTQYRPLMTQRTAVRFSPPRSESSSMEIPAPSAEVMASFNKEMAKENKKSEKAPPQPTTLKQKQKQMKKDPSWSKRVAADEGLKPKKKQKNKARMSASIKKRAKNAAKIRTVGEGTSGGVPGPESPGEPPAGRPAKLGIPVRDAINRALRRLERTHPVFVSKKDVPSQVIAQQQRALSFLLDLPAKDKLHRVPALKLIQTEDVELLRTQNLLCQALTAVHEPYLYYHTVFRLYRHLDLGTRVSRVYKDRASPDEKRTSVRVKWSGSDYVLRSHYRSLVKLSFLHTCLKRLQRPNAPLPTDLAAYDGTARAKLRRNTVVI